MALTAMAQYALPPEPSWDETIVPALRKRLEIESRLLSKRLSVHSITSTEDSISAYYFNGANSADLDNRSRTGNGATGVQDNHTRHKPSAIPRPSLQYSQDASDEQADVVGHTETMSAKPLFSRSRTYSQPYPFQADHHAPSSHNFHDSTLPTPNSSRSNSPMALNSNIRPLDVKPTRIPKVSQPRSGNSISHGHGVPPAGGRYLTKNGSVESHPLYHVNGEMPTDPRLVNGSGVSASSTQFTRPSSRSQDRNASGILNEQAPFVPTSIAASFADDEAQSRASTDEERPFEHWYRGDVARNGGVGEVRVASRKEMLDIANYGHKFRAQASRGAAVGGVAAFARGPRKRADSTGARESLYIDDAAARTVGDMVLDETPLTDLEADTETDRETGYTTPRETPQRASSRQHTRAAPTTSGATTALPRPSPSHARSEYVRGMSEPPELLSARLRTAPTTRGLPQSQSMSSAQNIPKRGRTKSTTTKSPGPASKKVNGLTAQQKRSKSNFDGKRAERSSEYPEPPDFPEGMADAIPSWTQPKMKAGNWDDVVLPVVARKMGLEDQYEEADGSPRPKEEDNRIPPAPGTFGYDYSKYRRYETGSNDIPMDEFGQMPAQSSVLETHMEDPATSPQSPRPKLSIDTDSPTRRSSSRRRKRSNPPSPLPFANYRGLADVGEESGRTAAYADHAAEQVIVERREEKNEAGCCRCVIM